MESNSDKIIHIATEQYLYVYNFTCKLTNDRDSALDFTQDTFRKAISKIDTFRDAPTVNNVRAWLTTIVKRTVIDAVRRRNTKPAITEIKPHHKIIESSISHFEKQDLYDAISKLPPPHKDLITHLLMGYKYEELSIKFSLPLGTIKGNLSRAKNMLYEHLAEIGYDKYYKQAKKNNIATERNKQKK